MPKFAIIENGAIANIINADQAFVDEQLAEAQTVDVTDIYCGVGWLYQDGVFSEVLQEDDSPPDWTAFRLAMLSSPAYNSKIEQVESSVAGQRIVRRLETAVMAVAPHLDSVIWHWNELIKRLPANSKPTLSEAQAWESIASSANVPIKYLDNGEMAAR